MRSGVRVARVVAGDIRIGDDLHLGHGWRRVVGRTDLGAMVEISCDEPPDQGPHAYGRREPVLVRWAVPQTTVAMARDLRRHPAAARAADQSTADTAASASGMSAWEPAARSRSST